MIESTVCKKSNSLPSNKKGTQVIQSLWERKMAGILKKKGSDFQRMVVQVT